MSSAHEPTPTSILDWSTTARRLRRVASLLAAVVVGIFVVASLVRGAPALALLGEMVGLALLTAFGIEVVVVGGAALRAMLTAGEQGERLASQDVGLLPPQLLRRARGETTCGPTTGCETPATAPDPRDPDAGTRGHG